MATTIRDVVAEDFPHLLTINNAAIPNVSTLKAPDLPWFDEHACYFRVALINGELAGFLIALAPGTTYMSANYRWFCDHYDEFVYIDRIVVAEAFRGLGVGRVFYADVQSLAEQHAPWLTCEVNLKPRNETSLLFHSTRGFIEVGQQDTEKGSKRVSLLAKELPPYHFVRQHYGQAQG